ncbi:MAG: 2-hydroxyglutaryl-CoA dehydratase [Mogibacterium sp.]|nr:2-hydroxyglutaryl-CoA dehydratase [Mogibacterium sp.]
MITLGIDIGSTTSKCALLEDGSRILGVSLAAGGIGTEGPEDALQQLWEQTGLSRDSVRYITVTGYGRRNYMDRDSEVSELTCHALGAGLRLPGVRTVIDIGGQDAKVISLSEDGKMTGFVMNDKCAAGTGRFLEVMAAILRLPLDELGAYALDAEKPASISSTCTVFAESEVISQLAGGEDRRNIAAGICVSVASRVGALARRAGITAPVCMSGGVARNEAVRRAMEENLGVPVACDPMAQYFGALGAALYGYRLCLRQNKEV